MRTLIFTASILSTLAITSTAQADNVKPVIDDGTIEHFESHSETSSSERTVTTHSPTRAVVETSSAWTIDETWSHSFYDGTTWTTDDGYRSESVHDQRTTIRKRPLHVPFVTQRSPTIGSQSPCSSSRSRCCPQ